MTILLTFTKFSDIIQKDRNHRIFLSCRKTEIIYYIIKEETNPDSESGFVIKIMGFFFGGGFQIMFTLVFILVMGIIVFTAVSGIVRWSKNNKAPRLSVNAAVVSKRIEISRHNHADAAGNMYMGSDTK